MAILTPGDPIFNFLLDNLPPPPGWRSHEAHGEVGLVQDLDSGVWLPVNQQEFLAILNEQGDRYFADD